MLEFLNLQDVGPAPRMEMTLARRINLITGDNGLGKSFLLDVAWWALTRSWARQPVRPTPVASAPEITSRYTKASPGPFSSSSTFDRKREKWPVPPGRPPIAGLVLYAQVDGGFSVWDPARNYWKKEAPDRPAAFSFTASEIWEGNALCEGLIRDWASWQREDGSAFAELRRVLDALSPSAEEPLQPGNLVKISVDDPKRYPTLAMPYGQDVPVIHASAGMRRIIALAYLLVWAWHEHLAASALLGDERQSFRQRGEEPLSARSIASASTMQAAVSCARAGSPTISRAEERSAIARRKRSCSAMRRSSIKRRSAKGCSEAAAYSTSPCQNQRRRARS